MKMLLTILIYFYLLVAFSIMGAMFYFVDFMQLTLMNKIIFSLVIVGTALIWPVLLLIIVVANFDKIKELEFDEVKQEILERISK